MVTSKSEAKMDTDRGDTHPYPHPQSVKMLKNTSCQLFPFLFQFLL